MAEKPGGKTAGKAGAPSPAPGVGWFVWGLIGIGVLWFFMGGYTRQESRQPYIKPAAPLDSGQTYGKTYITNAAKEKETLDLPDTPAIVIRNIQEGLRHIFTFSKRPTSRNIYFDGIGGAKESDVQREYLQIVADPSNKALVKITDLVLRGSGYGVSENGISARIPQVIKLPVLGVPYVPSDLEVPADGIIIVSSGKSPIGTSFQVNICTGYMNQFQAFTPNLRHDCPEPLTELENSPARGEQACRDFVASIPRCQAYSGSFPSTVSAECKLFVTDKLNYNSCVADHNTKNNFYLPEWRVFLGQTSELWKNKSDSIRIMDDEGRVIDTLAY